MIELEVLHKEVGPCTLLRVNEEEVALVEYMFPNSTKPNFLECSLEDLTYNGLCLATLLDKQFQQSYEAEREEELEASSPDFSEGMWFHPTAGRCYILEKSRDEMGHDLWLMGTEKESPTNPVILFNTVGFDVNDDELTRQIDYTSLRNFYAYPCELLNLSKIRKECFEVEGKDLYQACSDSDPEDKTMWGLEELVYPIKNLGRKQKRDMRGELVYRVHRTGGRELRLPVMTDPMVLVLGEASGKPFVTPAWWLRNVRTGERYQYVDPKKEKVVPAPSEGYVYNPAVETDFYYGDFSEMYTPNLAEIEDMVEAASKPLTPQEIMQELDMSASYWRIETPRLADFGFNKLRYANGVVEFVFQSKRYSLPVKTKDGELYIDARCSDAAKRALCRFVSYKLTEARMYDTPVIVAY